MYRILADGKVIYDSRILIEEFAVTNPSLSIGDNSAGSLTFTMAPTNNMYEDTLRMASTIRVYKHGEEIWEGRILNEDVDFFKNRKITCEGELAYLNDTIQPIAEYFELSPKEWLETLIAIHNEKSVEDHRFVVGEVTVLNNEYAEYIYTDYGTTYSYIQSMVEALGGHIKIRKQNGVRYIDYLDEEYDRTTNQTISFGQNLLDFTKTWDLSEFATVIVPMGEQMDRSPVEDATDYITIEDVNDGKNYLVNETALQTYGWIEKTVHFDDIDDLDAIKTKGEEYLRDNQFEKLVLKCNAVDLKDLGMSSDDIRVRDQIRVISLHHGMDRYFTVSAMTLDLADPSRNTYTIGNDTKTSLSSKMTYSNTQILGYISKLPTQQKVLRKAGEDAAARITHATTGYITLTQNDYGAESLIISPTQDYHESNNYWMWNLEGLMYTSDGGQTADVAITMDGAINANFITVGSLTAIEIDNGNGTFHVTPDGKLTASSANITGTIYASSGTIGGATIDSAGIRTSGWGINSSGSASFNQVTIGGTSSFAPSNANPIGGTAWTQIDGLVSIERARIGSLEADHVSVASLNAVSARVGSLEADHVSVASLNATNAAINSLSSKAITTDNLEAKIANISTLKVNILGVSGNAVKIGNFWLYYDGGTVKATITPRNFT